MIVSLALFQRKPTDPGSESSAPVPLPRITVGSWLEAYPEEILAPGENPHLHLLVSIGDVGEPAPNWLRKVDADRTLRLEFSDESLSPLGITELQLNRLVQEAKRLRKKQTQAEPLRIHVHCTAGVSRSPACAATILTTLHPELSDREVLTRIQEARPKMRPNGLVLRRTDDGLNRQLLRTWQDMEKAEETGAGEVDLLENQPDLQSR